MLPDLPGTEVCRQLRTDPSSATCPILLLTAKAEEIDRVVGFELGADDYVTKPFSPRELALRVRAILRRTSGERRRATCSSAARSRSTPSAIAAAWTTPR